MTLDLIRTTYHYKETFLNIYLCLNKLNINVDVNLLEYLLKYNYNLDFFKSIIQHWETTLTNSAKIGGLADHVWKNVDGVFSLIKGKKTGRGSGMRYGLFNNKTELFNVLLMKSNALMTWHIFLFYHNVCLFCVVLYIVYI